MPAAATLIISNSVILETPHPIEKNAAGKIPAAFSILV
jgi:hypothetical protein